MISRDKRRIRIHITTYKSEEHYQGHIMEEKTIKKCFNKTNLNNYVCAICLKPKTEERTPECCNKLHKSCPICQNNKDGGKAKDRESFLAEKETYCMTSNKPRDCKTNSPNTREIITNCCLNTKERVVASRESKEKDPNVKTVQTSNTSVSQGLTLLNEVLTVFQNKKEDNSKEKIKSGLFKDAAVSTLDDDDEKTPKDKAKLTVSTFQYSIDDKKNMLENDKFIIVNCCQPLYLKTQNSLDLIKHKSSSIPQMKLEELKYTLKQKTRSKDAIEEVNRMFATVRKCSRHAENSNRPMVRSGPRVLPLVKSHPVKKYFGPEHDEKHGCKCCQTCMSSGDSKAECCHNSAKDKCDKCVYMLCCHYDKSHKMQTGMMMCEHCRDLNDGQCDDVCHNCMEDTR